jgi:hypothetical protein
MDLEGKTGVSKGNSVCTCTAKRRYCPKIRTGVVHDLQQMAGNHKPIDEFVSRCSVPKGRGVRLWHVLFVTPLCELDDNGSMLMFASKITELALRPLS